MIFTKEEFKKRWDGDADGGGISNDDCVDCAFAWGLLKRPRTMPIEIVIDKVLEAAGCGSD